MTIKKELGMSLREILDYAEGKKGISYYDLETYAYDNDKDGWIAALKDKKTRQLLALYFQSKRRKDGTPYNNPRHVSMMKALDAKITYEKRHPFDLDTEDSE